MERVTKTTCMWRAVIHEPHKAGVLAIAWRREGGALRMFHNWLVVIARASRSGGVGDHLVKGGWGPSFKCVCFTHLSFFFLRFLLRMLSFPFPAIPPTQTSLKGSSLAPSPLPVPSPLSPPPPFFLPLF